MSPEELTAYAALAAASSDKQAPRIATYCRVKARAMALRLAGDITLAMDREAKCEALYDALPPRLRW